MYYVSLPKSELSSGKTNRHLSSPFYLLSRPLIDSLFSFNFPSYSCSRRANLPRPISRRRTLFFPLPCGLMYTEPVILQRSMRAHPSVTLARDANDSSMRVSLSLRFARHCAEGDVSEKRPPRGRALVVNHRGAPYSLE